MGENIAKGWKKFWCGFWKPVIMRINHVRPLNWFLGWLDGGDIPSSVGAEYKFKERNGRGVSLDGSNERRIRVGAISVIYYMPLDDFININGRCKTRLAIVSGMVCEFSIAIVGRWVGTGAVGFRPDSLAINFVATGK